MAPYARKTPDLRLSPCCRSRWASARTPLCSPSSTRCCAASSAPSGALVETGPSVAATSPWSPFRCIAILRDRQTVFSGVLATAGETPSRLTIPGPTGGSTDLDNMRVSFVSGNYFDVLGVQPVLGRVFGEEDDRNPGSSETLGSVIVISHAFWQQQFDRDPSVLGRTIVVGHSRCTVVIAPLALSVSRPAVRPVAWVPCAFLRQERRREPAGKLRGLCRAARARVGRARGQAVVTALFRQLLNDGRVRGPVMTQIALTPAATGIDLGLRRVGDAVADRDGRRGAGALIACANVANLLSGARWRGARDRCAPRLGVVAVGCCGSCSPSVFVQPRRTGVEWHGRPGCWPAWPVSAGSTRPDLQCWSF